MQGLLLRIGTTSDAIEKNFFVKKGLPRIFSNCSTKTVLCALGHNFNKVNRGIVQKPDAVRKQN